MKKLKQYLIEDENTPGSDNDFGKNIIPNMINAGEKLWPYRFEGYWRDVGTIISLWDANMDMLSPKLIDLYNENWPIRGRSPIRPPQWIGPNAVVEHSIITEGCEVEGKISNSVLSNSVIVGAGAEVNYSILMPGAEVGPGAVVEYAIIGENTKIQAGTHVGTQPDGSEDWGVATVGPGITVAPGAVVPAGAMIYESVEG